LDEFFQKELSGGQLMRITAYRLSIEQHAPNCSIVYDKFHVMQHANKAIDEVRRAEFFRTWNRRNKGLTGADAIAPVATS
jgi:hypothetical protein